jgi:hypothetical protein
MNVFTSIESLSAIASMLPPALFKARDQTQVTA